MPENVTLISDPTTIFIYLTGAVAFVFILSEVKQLKKLFHYLPPVIWAYFVPMISTTLGILPDSSPVYSLIRDYLLPFSLVLFLLSADLPGIINLG